MLGWGCAGDSWRALLQEGVVVPARYRRPTGSFRGLWLPYTHLWLHTPQIRARKQLWRLITGVRVVAFRSTAGGLALSVGMGVGAILGRFRLVSFIYTQPT